MLAFKLKLKQVVINLSGSLFFLELYSAVFIAGGDMGTFLLRIIQFTFGGEVVAGRQVWLIALFHCVEAQILLRGVCEGED